jgi:hypothetical protein
MSVISVRLCKEEEGGSRLRRYDTDRILLHSFNGIIILLRRGGRRRRVVVVVVVLVLTRKMISRVSSPLHHLLLILRKRRIWVIHPKKRRRTRTTTTWEAIMPPSMPSSQVREHIREVRVIRGSSFVIDSCTIGTMGCMIIP